MMAGVAPGIGKSTLATGLATALSPVDLFGEEQVFTRPAFAAVAQRFRTRTFPTPDVFLPAYAATFADLRATSAWGVLDWNCASMASDLPWALDSPTALRSFIDDVGRLAADLAPVAFFLEGDVLTATQRAVAERGPSFLAQWGAVVGEESIEAIAAHHRSLRPMHDADVRLLAEAGFAVHVLDATRPAPAVLSDALALLRWPSRPSRRCPSRCVN
jgi:hypothetical protein